MGGLFSSNPEPHEPHSTTSHPYRTTTSLSSHGSVHSRSSATTGWHIDSIKRQQEIQQRLLLEEQRRRNEYMKIQKERILPVSNRPLHRAALQQSFAENWDPMPSNVPFLRTDVQSHTWEYNKVVNSFKTTTQKRFKVVQIERVQNPYLLGCFLLKKEEMEKRYGLVEEREVFHGTKESNVRNICENNFDWKLHGDSIGNRYGKGVSFSPISYYASHYSDKRATEKMMFLARVLVSYTVTGNGDMIIPPNLWYNYGHDNILRYDTAQKENGHVVVKFCDNEFYPEYIIHYTVTQNVKRQGNNYDSSFDDY